MTCMDSRRRCLRALALAPGLGLAAAARAALTEGDAAQAVRAALERGAQVAVAQLGRSGGFLDNPAVRIALPGPLEELARIARLTGQQRRVDELVVSMNRAAEAAVPAGRTVLVQAVRSMSVEDARRILTGGDQSVTQFFSGKTRDPLTRAFLPIVGQSMQKVAVVEKLNALGGKAASMGLVGADAASLQSYVTGRTIDGVYRVIGEEERRIRQDPVGTGSALLARVFGTLR